MIFQHIELPAIESGKYYFNDVYLVGDYGVAAGRPEDGFENSSGVLRVFSVTDDMLKGVDLTKPGMLDGVSGSRHDLKVPSGMDVAVLGETVLRHVQARSARNEGQVEAATGLALLQYCGISDTQALRIMEVATYSNVCKAITHAFGETGPDSRKRGDSGWSLTMETLIHKLHHEKLEGVDLHMPKPAVKNRAGTDASLGTITFKM